MAAKRGNNTRLATALGDLEVARVGGHRVLFSPMVVFVRRARAAHDALLHVS